MTDKPCPNTGHNEENGIEYVQHCTLTRNHDGRCVWEAPENARARQSGATPKPDTPPAGPSGVSHTPPVDLADVTARMTAAVEASLRHLFDVVGIEYTEPIVEAKREFAGDTAHHLEAMAQAWTEGYDDGREDGRYDERYAEGINPNAVPKNPYRKLIDDRREFVRELVENEYGALPGDDGAIDNVLGDDNAEWFDAVLDAHDEWHAMQRRPADTRDDVESLRIRAEQAEARVAQLDRALRDVKDALDYDTGYNAVKINGARIALARAGYGTHPDSDAWVPPYSAGQALNRIWDVISTQRVSPVYKLNRVLEILDEMGYHEHVHVALPSWSAPEVCGNTYGQKVCSRKPGHYGEHVDGRHPDITWKTTTLASEVADEGLEP